MAAAPLPREIARKGRGLETKRAQRAMLMA